MWKQTLRQAFGLNLKQPAHFDFEPEKLVGLTNCLMPLLVVVALQDDTFLDIWVGYKGLNDGSIPSPVAPTRIKLNQGFFISISWGLHPCRELLRQREYSSPLLLPRQHEWGPPSRQQNKHNIQAERGVFIFKSSG